MEATRARVCRVRDILAMTSEEEELTSEEDIPVVSTQARPDKTFHKTIPEVNRGQAPGPGECTEATLGPPT